MKVGVTGATGFVGRALRRRLDAAGFECFPIVRHRSGLDREIITGDLSSSEANEISLPPLDALIHLAARAHVMVDKTTDPLAEYQKVNVIGTRRIAEAAVRAGIAKFIFLSSIKVNGESTTLNQPFQETDTPLPLDAYGQSKLEAESVVRGLYGVNDRNWTIVRAPLVYGPGVKGNFKLLVKLATSGLPLPFRNIDNQRSVIFVNNLADFLICTLTQDAARNELFLISDEVDLSTREIVEKIAESSGKSLFLLPFPPAGIKWMAKLAGRGATADRLTGNLQIDSSKARNLLRWSPTFDVAEAFEQTVGEDPPA